MRLLSLTLRPPAALALAVLALVALLVPAPSAAASRLGPLPVSFSGVLPCADCQGIRHELTLHPGGGYMLALTYLRGDSSETVYDMGSFTTNRDSTRVALVYSDPDAMQFEVTPAGSLRKLDRRGFRIDSKLDYELRREPALLLLEPRLTMEGTYSYMADAGVFQECRSGLQFAVLPNDGAHALERTWLAEGALLDSLAKLRAASSRSGEKPASTPQGAGERSPLLVRVSARVLAKPPAGFEGTRPMLEIQSLEETYPNESCGARGVTHPLSGVRWVLTRIGREPLRLDPRQREPMVTFDSMNGRVAGFSGCNRFSGSYLQRQPGGPYLIISGVGGTRMACVGPDIETPFLRELDRVATHRIVGAHLELFDASGKRVLRFEAREL